MQPARYAPYATRLIALRAMDFGGAMEIEHTPLASPDDAIEAHLTSPDVRPSS